MRNIPSGVSVSHTCSNPCSARHSLTCRLASSPDDPPSRDDRARKTPSIAPPKDSERRIWTWIAVVAAIAAIVFGIFMGTR